MAHSWFMGQERVIERMVSLSPAPPTPTSTPHLAAGPLAREAGVGKEFRAACEAELGAWGKGAEAAGPGSPEREALVLCWVVAEVLSRSDPGQDEAAEPQPSGESTTRDNLLSASRIPTHFTSSLTVPLQARSPLHPHNHGPFLT